MKYYFSKHLYRRSCWLETSCSDPQQERSRLNYPEELRKAHESRTIIRVYRDGAISSYIAGYVTGIGDALLALLAINSGVQYDGFIVVRLEDISGLRMPGDWSEFTERALERRKEVPPTLPLDLRSWKTVIESSRDAYPVARFQCFDDETDEEVSWTCGRAIDVDDSIVRVRPIDPGAVWERAEELLSLGKLIRMDFGGILEVMLGELARDARLG